MALRTALIGFGAMGRNHARVLEQLEDFELCAVVDHEITDAQTPVETFATVRDLDFSQIDVAVIATPSGTHESIGIPLLQGAIHTLVEKPLAASLDGAMNLIAARDQSGATAMVGHLERFNPAISALQVLIASGSLGEIYQFASRRQGYFPERITDVGVAKDLAVHDIDLCRYLTKHEYRTLFASSSHRSAKGVEDFIVASGKLDNGIIFNHVVNWMSPFKERQVVISGSGGTAVADTVSGELSFFENGAPATGANPAFFPGVARGAVHRLETSGIEPLVSELRSFARAVEKKEPVGCTLEDGVAAMAVVEAAIKSAEHNEVMALIGSEMGAAPS